MQRIYARNPLRIFLSSVWIILLLANGHLSSAQSGAPVQWSWQPNLLWGDTLWKYHSGVAKPEYFEAGFDDQHWQHVHNDFTGLGLNNQQWTGIGVFRKKFYVPDSLRGKKMSLIILFDVGASIIYLDGKEMARFGKLSENAKDEIVKITNAFPKNLGQFDLDSQSTHVLAVYHSNHDPIAAGPRLGASGFVFSITPPHPDEEVQDRFPHYVISVCIILFFCLFFLCVYAFYPNRLASLMSALLLANFSLIFVGGIISEFADNTKYLVFGDNIFRFAFTCHAAWYLLFMYSLYYKKMPARSWIPVVVMILASLVAISIPKIPIRFMQTVAVLFYLETWHIMILGIRKKRTGFWILAIGMFLSNMGSIFVIFDTLHLFSDIMTNTLTTLGLITDLSFPLTLALQFALEFGSANRDLRKQLTQVSSLSKKNLEQEQEKQQILSTQNETLERQVSERTSEVVAQTKEIEKQRDQVTNTLGELRAAQNQLIQSEKMASLGELTAGIAHEIQNPLNFVNNFSEVNAELIEEMKKEIDAGHLELAKNIADNLEQNTEKITHHGKRADAIVKGMLQHSRKSTGQKEPTDVNTLADEYLRLSYQGLRAKDKSFNAALETHFDEHMGKINIIPQDIGRVLLNLFNNAFYAVSEKFKKSAESYTPKVTVRTKRENGMFEISVGDNGNGIPKNILDKIFQPFFTTKPTGEGTGLGLSLSYDIVKAHGGELSVETKEGRGSEFVIHIPAV